MGGTKTVNLDTEYSVVQANRLITTRYGRVNFLYNPWVMGNFIIDLPKQFFCQKFHLLAIYFALLLVAQGCGLGICGNKVCNEFS